MSNRNANTIDDSVPTSVGRRVAVLLVGLPALVLFVPRLFGHPWLDELGSYWVVKDDLRMAFQRTLELQGRSPLYFIVLWSAVQVLGIAPWALRMPSLIFTALSSLVMFRLGALLGGRTVGLLSVFGFLVSSQLTGVALEARPYALAILCAAVSSLLFLRWLSTPTRLLAFMYSFSAALTIYAHYLFGAVFAAHLMCFLLSFKQAGGNERRELLSGALLIVATLMVLVFPALTQIRSLSSRTAELSFAAPPTISTVLRALVPFDVLLVLALIFCFRLTIWRGRAFGWRDASLRKAIFPIAILILTPPLFVAAASLISGHSLWLERYYSWQCLGIGIGIGLILSLLPNLSSQLVVMAAVLLIKVAMQLANISDWRDREGWGKVLGTLRTNDPMHECLVLSMSGFVESRMLGRGSTAALEDFMRAPLAYYKIANENTLIPYSLDDQHAQIYFQNTTAPALSRAHCAWLLYRNVKLYSERSSEEHASFWMRRNLPELGFLPAYELSAGFVTAVRYDRKRSLPVPIN